MLVIAVCLAIFVAVAGLLTYTILRFRRRAGDVDREPPQVYGSQQIEIAWTVIPVLIVIVLTIATARVITDVQDKHPPPDALFATVIGHQWWWEIRYPSLAVVTAHELHVPVSAPSRQRPTFLKLESGTAFDATNLIERTESMTAAKAFNFSSKGESLWG